MTNEHELRASINQLQGLINDIYWTLDSNEELSAIAVDSMLQQAKNLESLAEQKIGELELLLAKS